MGRSPMAKTREQREQELLRIAERPDGAEIITQMWKEAKGIPSGADALYSIGAAVKTGMIPEILAQEYPGA